MRRSHLLALFTAAALCLFGLAYRSYASPELGLVARYVEELDGSPLLAGIFDAQTKRTYEYGPGDYVKGLVIRQILKDRIVLVDEVTKYQYVLVVNELELDEEPGDVDVIRLKRRKRELEDMDVTAEFNREMAKAEGTFRLLGAGSQREADDAQAKMNQKGEALGGQNEETMPRSPLRDKREEKKDGGAAPGGGGKDEDDDKAAMPSAVTPYQPPAPGKRPSSPKATAPATPAPAPAPKPAPKAPAAAGTTEVQ